ncbi:MAG: HAD family hydrolase [Lachnospiraceae bacterium]|nr:HAD family hydrolase [Lachnospiraceae bacterium]
MRTDGIIFDIDGTIWDSTGIVADAWNEAAESTGYTDRRVSSEDLKGLFGKQMEEIVLALFPEVSDKERSRLLVVCRDKEQEYLQNDPCDGIAYPGICSTIESLSRDIPVFIVSNCQSGYIELVCEKLLLGEYIKDSECYGDTQKGKAENLKLLCRRNGLKAPVYVGDTEGDRQACEEAGVPFIFASYGFGAPVKYDAKISSPEELLTLFSQ